MEVCMYVYNGPVPFVSRLTLVMTTIMFLRMVFSQPTWEVSGTHLRVSTYTLRSPALSNWGRLFQLYNIYIVPRLGIDSTEDRRLSRWFACFQSIVCFPLNV